MGGVRRRRDAERDSSGGGAPPLLTVLLFDPISTGAMVFCKAHRSHMDNAGARAWARGAGTAAGGPARSGTCRWRPEPAHIASELNPAD